MSSSPPAAGLPSEQKRQKPSSAFRPSEETRIFLNPENNGTCADSYLVGTSGCLGKLQRWHRERGEGRQKEAQPLTSVVSKCIFSIFHPTKSRNFPTSFRGSPRLSGGRDRSGMADTWHSGWKMRKIRGTRFAELKDGPKTLFFP